MLFRNKLSAKRSVLRMAVDPISNTVAITSANPLYAPSQDGAANCLERDWGLALGKGTLSYELLPSILHELTHHSSLQTPVGRSLSALALSHTSNIIGACEDVDILVGSSRDRILSAAANLFLKPLLEGMSLFQEFDATSGSVPIATWATLVAARLFTAQEQLPALLAGKDISSVLKARLESMRQSPETIARKKDLLRTGLDDDPNGYLIGYLLIKTIFLDLIARNKTWLHSDMFLMFINDYFFSDFTFALLLVAPPGESIEKDLDNIEQYLMFKLVALAQNAHEYGVEFLTRFIGGSPTRPSYHRFTEDISRRLDWQCMQKMLLISHYHTPDFLAGRTHPRLLAAPATVGIDEQGRFNAEFGNEFPPFHGVALEVARPISGGATAADGSVEAIALLPQNGRENLRILICVFLDKELVATFDPETRVFNDEDAAKACDKLGSYLAYESLAVQVDESLPSVPPESRLAKYLSRYSGEEGTQRMIKLWQELALISDIGVSERPDVAELMNKQGINGPLSLNSISFGKLVRFSLCPLDPETPSFPITNEDSTWIADINARSKETLGFSLLTVEDGRLKPSRI